jgi:hypothetical protein
MTHERDLDRLLDTWFADGPVETPDRVLDDVAARIHRQPQRPAWRLALRENPVNAYLKPLAAIAAVITIAAFGLYLVREPSGVAAPAPTPSPTPTIAATASSSPEPSASAPDVCVAPGCGGVLEPGTHTSANFQPTVRYEVPDGWINELDDARGYTLLVEGGPDMFFQLLSGVAIPEQDDLCRGQRREGVDTTPAAWATFLGEHPGLEATTPEPVTIGGAEGYRVSFRVAPGWEKRCPGSLGPAVYTVTNEAGEWVLFVDDQRSTFWILDVEGSTVIIRLETSPSEVEHQTVLGTVQPVLESMSFAPAP